MTRTAATKGAGFQPIPGIKPLPPDISLLSVAKKLPGGLGTAPTVEHQDGALPDPVGQPLWKSGVEWRSAACAPGYRWPYCGYGDATGPGAGGTTKQAPALITSPGFYPYEIYVPYRCDWVTTEEIVSPSGGTISAADYRQDALDELEAITPFHVSQELWTGSIEALNPSLESVAVDKSAVGAVHPVEALAILMDAWASGAPQGAGTPIFHAPWSVVISLMANHIVNQVGDALYGPGCYVSPGPGYPSDGTGGPANASAGAGNLWTYLSGPVEYALGAPDALPDDNSAQWDRRSNTYQVWTQRMAIHRFDTCAVFACKTAKPNPGTGVV